MIYLHRERETDGQRVRTLSPDSFKKCLVRLKTGTSNLISQRSDRYTFSWVLIFWFSSRKLSQKQSWMSNLGLQYGLGITNDMLITMSNAQPLTMDFSNRHFDDSYYILHRVTWLFLLALAKYLISLSSNILLIPTSLSLSLIFLSIWIEIIFFFVYYYANTPLFVVCLTCNMHSVNTWESCWHSGK